MLMFSLGLYQETKMSRIFFIQYEVKPLPPNEEYQEIIGAYANCFISAQSATQAETLALQNFLENHWEVVGIEEQVVEIFRHEYSGEWLEWYDLAVNEGGCYVYHQWSEEE